MTDSSRSAVVERPRRTDESMSLLVDIASQALDPGYATAAARRGGTPPPRRPRAWLLVAGVLAATLLIVVAGVQAHRRAPVASRSRDALVHQVERRSDAVSALQARLDRLRATTARLRDTALTTTAAGDRLAGRLATAELAAGTIAVTGPGLRVSVDDATDGDNRVVDRDLQSVINALWSAGAEAIGVNGERVTAQTAVRAAGGAILVNFRPLDPPYVVSAIGDPVALESDFATSRAASRLRAYEQLYGLRFHYARESTLTLPSAPGMTLRYAQVARVQPSGEGGAR